MKFIIAETDALDASETNPRDLGLISQGACDAGALYITNGDAIPDGFRVATAEEIEHSHMYQARKKQLNKLRDNVIDAGVEVDGIGLFDTDLTAQLRQCGGLQLATLPIIRQMYSTLYKMAEDAGDTETVTALNDARHEFVTPWVLKDNQQVTLGFDEFKIIGPAVASAVAAQVIDARNNKDAQLDKLVAGEIAQ